MKISRQKRVRWAISPACKISRMENGRCKMWLTQSAGLQALPTCGSTYNYHHDVVGASRLEGRDLRIKEERKKRAAFHSVWLHENVVIRQSSSDFEQINNMIVTYIACHIFDILPISKSLSIRQKLTKNTWDLHANSIAQTWLFHVIRIKVNGKCVSKDLAAYRLQNTAQKWTLLVGFAAIGGLRGVAAAIEFTALRESLLTTQTR